MNKQRLIKFAERIAKRYNHELIPGENGLYMWDKNNKHNKDNEPDEHYENVEEYLRKHGFGNNYHENKKYERRFTRTYKNIPF